MYDIYKGYFCGVKPLLTYTHVSIYLCVKYMFTFTNLFYHRSFMWLKSTCRAIYGRLYTTWWRQR